MVHELPGPIGCVRLGEIDGEFVVNPTNEQMYDSSLDLIYVGSEKEMMMIEGSADQIPEERFVQALEFAHESIQDIISAQKELAELCGKEKKEFDLVQAPTKFWPSAAKSPETGWKKPFSLPPSRKRQVAVDAVKEEASAGMREKFGEDFDSDHVKMAFEVIQEEVYRENILVRGKRADGRGPNDLREITCETGILPGFTVQLFSPAEKPIACPQYLGNESGRTGLGWIDRWTLRQILHPTLQFPSFFRGRGRSLRLYQQKGNRSRSVGRTLGFTSPTSGRRLPLRNPRSLRNHVFQWLDLHGQRLRGFPCTDGRRGSPEQARCRNFHWVGNRDG